jgi:exopolyphosphatase/guanosine-5'-triphosphate,3'-diphosphate pyrophosphatase
VIFDTGGGSTEITLVKNGEVKRAVSLPLGAVMLTESLAGKGQMQLYRYVLSVISEIHWLDECEGLPLYGIGGSARTLASLYKERILSYDELDGLKVPYDAVAKVYQNIFNTPLEKRKDIKGMDINRADIILAGATPCKVLMDMIGSPCMYVCASGVKEGVFFRLKDEILRRNQI